MKNLILTVSLFLVLLPNTYAQNNKLFKELPKSCNTPDGMTVTPSGDLLIACPNFADLSYPAVIMKIAKGTGFVAEIE